LKKEITLAASSAVALIILLGSASYLLFPKVSVQAYTASIDVFTQKGGQGKDQLGGTFAPLEWMNLTAQVRNASNNPVGDILVSFEVFKPANATTGATIAIVGTAMTNSSGMAVYDFRIPPSAAPNTIGIWLVYATAPVDDQVVADTLTFSVLQ
jgi:hypothetical protein